MQHLVQAQIRFNMTRYVTLLYNIRRRRMRQGDRLFLVQPKQGRKLSLSNLFPIRKLAKANSWKHASRSETFLPPHISKTPAIYWLAPATLPHPTLRWSKFYRRVWEKCPDGARKHYLETNPNQEANLRNLHGTLIQFHTYSFIATTHLLLLQL